MLTPARQGCYADGFHLMAFVHCTYVFYMLVHLLHVSGAEPVTGNSCVRELNHMSSIEQRMK